MIQPQAFSATSQIWFGGNDGDLSTTQSRFTPIQLTDEALISQNNSARSRSIMPTAGDAKNMRIEVETAPGAGNSWQFVLREDGSDTVLDCTISGASDTTCEDSDSVTFAAGGQINLRYLGVSTPTASSPNWSFEWVPDTDDETVMLFYQGAVFGNDNFITPGTSVRFGETTEDDAQGIASTAGTFSDLFVTIRDPGSPETIVVTLDIDESATAVTCTITGGSSDNCSDTTNTVTISATQKYTVTFTNSGGNDSHEVSGGIVFVPDTTGEAMTTFTTDDTPSNSATTFSQFGAGDGDFKSTDDVVARNMGQVGSNSTVTISHMYVELYNSPGSGNTWAITLYKDGSATSLTCSITGAGQNTDCNNGTDVSVSDGSVFSIEYVPTSTPNAPDEMTVGFLVVTASATANLTTVLHNSVLHNATITSGA